jgi:hypothetical protein
MATQTLYERTQDAIEELKNWMKENPEGDATDTEIFELADSACPIYYSDILELAANHISLATDVPEMGPAFGGEPTPINIIAANIFEHIYNELNSWYSDHKDDYLDLEEDE